MILFEIKIILFETKIILFKAKVIMFEIKITLFERKLYFEAKVVLKSIISSQKAQFLF